MRYSSLILCMLNISFFLRKPRKKCSSLYRPTRKPGSYAKVKVCIPKLSVIKTIFAEGTWVCVLLVWKFFLPICVSHCSCSPACKEEVLIPRVLNHMVIFISVSLYCSRWRLIRKQLMYLPPRVRGKDYCPQPYRMLNRLTFCSPRGVLSFIYHFYKVWNGIITT